MRAPDPIKLAAKKVEFEKLVHELTGSLEDTAHEILHGNNSVLLKDNSQFYYIYYDEFRVVAKHRKTTRVERRMLERSLKKANNNFDLFLSRD